MNTSKLNLITKLSDKKYDLFRRANAEYQAYLDYPCNSVDGDYCLELSKQLGAKGMAIQDLLDRAYMLQDKVVVRLPLDVGIYTINEDNLDDLFDIRVTYGYVRAYYMKPVFRVPAPPECIYVDFNDL